MSLGFTFAASWQYSIAIPHDPTFLALPITMQGVAIDPAVGSVELTNAIATRVQD